jgi:hypothetical protein
MGHRRTGFYAVVEAGTKDARDDAYNQSFRKIKFLYTLFLFFFRQFAFLEYAGPSADIDPRETKDDTRQHHLAPMSSQQFVKGCLSRRGDEVIIDRGDQGAKRGGKAQEHGVAERHTQVAHAQSVHETADTPEDTPEVGPPEGTGVGVSDDLREMRDREPCRERRDDQPGEQTADDPIAFPGPVSHLFIGDVKTA